MRGMIDRKIVTYAVIIAILLLLLVFMYSTLPALQGMNEAKKEWQQKQVELNEKKILAENLLQFGPQDEFSLDSIRNDIPERPDIEFILRDLKSLELSSGIAFSNYNVAAIDSISSDNGEEETNSKINNNAIVPLEVSFTFRGKRAQLVNLLREIEYVERIYTVRKLNLTTDANVPVSLQSPNETVNGAMTLTTYYVPGLQKHFIEPRPLDTF
jgi:Tfp pilus assembly protein PilO